MSYDDSPLDDSLFHIDELLGGEGFDFPLDGDFDSADTDSTGVDNNDNLSYGSFGDRQNSSVNQPPSNRGSISQVNPFNKLNTQDYSSNIPPSSQLSNIQHPAKLQKNELELIANSSSIAQRKRVVVSQGPHPSYQQPPGGQYISTNPQQQYSTFSNGQNRPTNQSQQNQNYSSHVPQSYRYGTPANDPSIPVAYSKYPASQTNGNARNGNAANSQQNSSRDPLEAYNTFPGPNPMYSGQYPENKMPNNKPSGYSRETIKRPSPQNIHVSAERSAPFPSRYEPYQRGIGSGYPQNIRSSGSPMRISGNSVNNSSYFADPTQGINMRSSGGFNPYSGQPNTIQQPGPLRTLQNQQNRNSQADIQQQLPNGFFSAYPPMGPNSSNSVRNPSSNGSIGNNSSVSAQRASSSHVWNYIHNNFEQGPHASHITLNGGSSSNNNSKANILPSRGRGSPVANSRGATHQPGYPPSSMNGSRYSEVPDYYKNQHSTFSPAPTLQTAYSLSQSMMLQQISNRPNGNGNGMNFDNQNPSPAPPVHSQGQQQQQQQYHSPPVSDTNQRSFPQVQPPSYPPSSQYTTQNTPQHNAPQGYPSAQQDKKDPAAIHHTGPL